MTAKSLVIIGAGGFAQEVRWLLSEITTIERTDWVFRGYVVSDTSSIGPHDARDELLGDFAWLERNRAIVDGLALGIGSPKPRFQFGHALARDLPEADWPVLAHPSVEMDWQTSSIGEGAIICAGVVGTVDVSIESFAMVNLSCTLGHGCRIGSGSALNPSVNISGGVDVGQRVLIGTGAQILQYTSIGDGAIVGAGAVVIEDVAPESKVVGVPARELHS